MKWKIGDVCYFLSNNRFIYKGVVVAVHGSVIQIKYGDAGIRLHAKRIFHTEEEAKGSIVRPIKSPHL